MTRSRLPFGLRSIWRALVSTRCCCARVARRWCARRRGVRCLFNVSLTACMHRAVCRAMLSLRRALLVVHRPCLFVRRRLLQRRKRAPCESSLRRRRGCCMVLSCMLGGALCLRPSACVCRPCRVVLCARSRSQSASLSRGTRSSPLLPGSSPTLTRGVPSAVLSTIVAVATLWCSWMTTPA